MIIRYLTELLNSVIDTHLIPRYIFMILVVQGYYFGSIYVGLVLLGRDPAKPSPRIHYALALCAYNASENSLIFTIL